MPEQYVGVKFNYKNLGELELDSGLNTLVLELQQALSKLPPECIEDVAGNISVKIHDGILITSTGSRLGRLIAPKNFCKVTSKFSDELVCYYGSHIPSSETKMHLLIHEKRPDVRYCLHIHLPNIEKVQLLNRHPITKNYYPYGTVELAYEATNALGSNNLVILKDHGIVIVGADLKRMVEEVSKLCNI